MSNKDTDAAWEYHNYTKHSLQSVRASSHYLDWSNRPRPYKLYGNVEALPLPQQLLNSSSPALSAISNFDVPTDRECIPDLTILASLLHYSAGITRWLRASGGGQMAFRAAACTGALYHIELYLVCADLPDMESGVYQFSVHDMKLRRLRRGDYRGVLVEATDGEPRVTQSPVTIVCTSTYWRNSWKYQARTFRHCFWDSGTILANLLAVAATHGLPTHLVAGFVDDQVNLLLDVDTRKEVTLCLISLGYAPSMRPSISPRVERLNLDTIPLSMADVDYPAIHQIHSASSLSKAEEVTNWRGAAQPNPLPDPSGKIVHLSPLKTEEEPLDNIETAITRRGSTRRFLKAPISLQSLSTILSAATAGIPADFINPSGSSLNDLYLIVNAVEGLESGSYVFHREHHSLEILRAGDFRRQAGYLDLGQELSADAAVNIYFLADLEPILERFGNRGYRVAQLEASVTAGKIYLASYALHLGASGLTFFDDDVTSFFSPHAQGKSVMFLIALGVPDKHRQG